MIRPTKNYISQPPLQIRMVSNVQVKVTGYGLEKALYTGLAQLADTLLLSPLLPPPCPECDVMVRSSSIHFVTLRQP